MIKFKSLEFLGLSYRIPGKIKNAIYLSALVLEVFKFEKCVKCANKRTEDISSQGSKLT